MLHHVTDPVASGYDAVFAAMPNATTFHRLWRTHACGDDFPPDFYHISFVTLAELRRIARDLALAPEDTLVDIGCGMGGPALWLARQTGAHVIGVDASSAGVGLANERAAQLGLADRARFRIGTFASTGLAPESANGIVSEDALQYAPDKRAVFAEAQRVLAPGGRFVFTAFELAPERVAGLPVLGVDPVEDFAPLLKDAGFGVDLYEGVRGWPEPMTSAYQALIDAKDELTEEMGEAAVTALMSELTVTLQIRPYRRRVLVSATKQT